MLYNRQLDLFHCLEDISPLIQEASELTNWGADAERDSVTQSANTCEFLVQLMVTHVST